MPCDVGGAHPYYRSAAATFWQSLARLQYLRRRCCVGLALFSRLESEQNGQNTIELTLTFRLECHQLFVFAGDGVCDLTVLLPAQRMRSHHQCDKIRRRQISDVLVRRDTFRLSLIICHSLLLWQQSENRYSPVPEIVIYVITERGVSETLIHLIA